MVACGTSALSNPMLRYRLDLGEPGIPTPSRASHSVVRVLSHELGNIHRFKAEAAREGGIVVYHGIKLNLTQKGPFLAAVGGVSEARIRYPQERLDTPGAQQDRSEETPRDSKETASFREAVESPARLTRDVLSTLTTQSAITRLQVGKAHLQRELRGSEARTDSPVLDRPEPPPGKRDGLFPVPNDPDLPVQGSPKEAIRKYQIQQKLHELNQEISRLTFESQPDQEEEPTAASSRISSADLSVEPLLLDVLV